MLRRTFVTAAVLLPLGMLLAGCAPIRVSSHLERGADFARYHTFAWGPADALPTGDPRLDNNPFFHDYLAGTVERRLREHGITLAANPAYADLQIHYHATVAQRADVRSVTTPAGANYHEPEVVEYDESTIVLDFVDARTQRLVWRGWAQTDLRAVIGSQQRMERQIEKSVVEMLKRLPI